MGETDRKTVKDWESAKNWESEREWEKENGRKKGQKGREKNCGEKMRWTGREWERIEEHIGEKSECKRE